MEIHEFIAQNQKPKLSVCEVGCYNGDTTIIYAPLIKELGGTITVVDWFQGSLTVSENEYHGHRPDKAKEVLDFFIERMTSIGCMDICRILNGRSQDIHYKIRNNSLDICYIDASHRYEDCLADIKNFLPKVKKGGILCGHDYDCADGSKTDMDCVNGCHPGVVQAVKEVFGTEIEVYKPLWVKRL